MSTSKASANQNNSGSPQRPGTAPATAPKAAGNASQAPANASQKAQEPAAAPQGGNPVASQGTRPGATKPWVDLAPNQALGMKPSRDKTVPAVEIEMTSREGGATLQEIKEALVAIGKGHHDPGQGLRWLNANRGFGFRMPNKETGKIFIDYGPQQKKAG